MSLPPPAIVLSSLMALSIMESPSRLFNYLPMPAFVGTDAAKALRVLEPFDMLLNRATGNKFLQRPKDHVEHEVDKGAGIARLLRGMKRLVVSALVAQYQ